MDDDMIYYAKSPNSQGYQQTVKEHLVEMEFAAFGCLFICNGVFLFHQIPLLLNGITHNLFLGGICSINVCSNPSISHNNDPVANAKNFR